MRPLHHSTLPLAAALVVCALAAVLAGCKSSLARVNDDLPIAQAVHQQEIPLEAPGIKSDKVPTFDLKLPDLRLPAIDFSSYIPTRQVPSNDRDWVPEQTVLPLAEFDGDRVTIHNVRNGEFFSYHDCLVDYYDKTYDLAQIAAVDFIQIPFNENRAIAHTFLSFAFADGAHVAISVEVRLEKGEVYSPGLGLIDQYELMYVVADEHDVIPVRTEQRACDVYLYRTRATPAQARELFVDMLQRANELRKQPEFYNTLTNNCTTNIVRHVNQLVPGQIHYDYRVLLPGYADELAYELGLLDNRIPFTELKRLARINDLVHRYKDDPQFSARIRGEKVPR